MAQLPGLLGAGTQEMWGVGTSGASVLKEGDLALGLGGRGFGSCPTSF